MPALSTDYKTYLDRDSFILLFSFNLLLDILSFLPIGAVVNGRRMNGKRLFYFLICNSIHSQLDGVKLGFFHLMIHSFKYQRSTTSGCKDIGIKKCEFEEKAYFFYRHFIFNLKIISCILFLGFLTLMSLLAVVPVLVHYKVIMYFKKTVLRIRIFFIR